MAAEYQIELRDFTTGTRLAWLSGSTGSGRGFLRLTVSKRINAPGLMVVELPGDYPDLSHILTDKTQVLLKRRDAARGIAWYTEFVGIARDPEYRSRGGVKTWTLTCPGLMSILSWYHVLWPANTTNRTVFTAAKAETVMKTLVNYNAVATTATAANGRDRNAPNYGVSVQADAGNGTTIDWTANRAKTLLSELQAIATVAGGDFDLAYVSPTSREFRFYAGQRGFDRTATVTFAEHLGNMDNVRFRRVRSSERTAALVAGTGQEAARSTTIRTGANYSSTNDIEVFVDARNLNPDTASARQARGDARLDELEARDEFSFEVVQTEGLFYKGSYDLGDLITAVKPDGVSVAQQIVGVDLEWTPDGEAISIETRTR
jgi:hypothetical protein